MSKYSEKLDQVRSLLRENSSLLIVSKNRALSEIQEYINLGHKDFGENKVQELKQKSQELSGQMIDWHMIGHLQTNKVKALLEIPGLKYIHSVDRMELVKELVKYDSRLNHPVHLFLQVKTSFEAEKSGFTSDADLIQAAALIDKCKNLTFIGLMTMGAVRTDEFEKEAHRCFRELRDQKERLFSQRNLKLSMGMSQDYQIALQEGSNWIRLGTSMFE